MNDDDDDLFNETLERLPVCVVAVVRRAGRRVDALGDVLRHETDDEVGLRVEERTCSRLVFRFG